MELVSILDKLDPEVAKALIGTMPEAIKGMVEIEKLYSELLKKSMESCVATAESCFKTEDKIVETLAKEVEKDIPFEQKQYYVDQMVSAAERKEHKDTEHRSTMDKIMQYGGMALTLGFVLLVGLFLGGNSDGSSSNIN